VGISTQISVHVNKIMRLPAHLGDYQLFNEHSVPKVRKDKVVPVHYAIKTYGGMEV
jgi:hypothetical protein